MSVALKWFSNASFTAMVRATVTPGPCAVRFAPCTSTTNCCIWASKAAEVQDRAGPLAESSPGPSDPAAGSTSKPTILLAHHAPDPALWRTKQPSKKRERDGDPPQSSSENHDPRITSSARSRRTARTKYGFSDDEREPDRVRSGPAPAAEARNLERALAQRPERDNAHPQKPAK